MKKKLLIVSILISMLLCINVKAKTFLPDEVDTSTYIVGTHMFTMDGSDVYDGVFTTEWIMYASKSIESDNYEDMIIYRKNAHGDWVNAISGAAITPPEEGFEIEFIDEVNVISLDDPVRIEITGEPAPLIKIIGFNRDDFCALGDEHGCNEYAIDGIEVYKVLENNQYELLDLPKEGEDPEAGSDNLAFPLFNMRGVQMTVVARVYKEIGGRKEYSAYSNTLDIDTTIPTPGVGEGGSTFLQREFGPTGYGDNGSYCIGECEEGAFEISGFEVYKKNGNNYEKIGEKTELAPYIVTMLPNKQETYAIRMFIEFGEPAERFYSDYGIINFDTTVPVPVVSPSVGQPGANPVHCNGTLCSVDIGSGMPTNSEYEDIYQYTDLFEEVENGDDILVQFSDEAGYTGIPTGGVRMIDGVRKGSVKYYYARAYIMVNGQKYYSEPTDTFIVRYTAEGMELESAVAIDASRATEYDNAGIAANNGKYIVQYEDNTITVTNSGMTPYIGGNIPGTAKYWVGIIVDFGVRVEGTGYNIADVDYEEASRWGATSETAFVLWTITDADREITFTNVNDANDSITINIEFEGFQEGND